MGGVRVPGAGGTTMIHGGTEHPKVKSLAVHLGVEHLVAVGVWESLLHWTATYAPAGDVGKYDTRVWAEGIHWRGSAKRLLRGLVDAGLVEFGEDGKARVHHWSQHCDEYIHRRLGRKGERFCDGTFPKLSNLDSREREQAGKLFARRWPDEWESLGKGGHGGAPAGHRRGKDGEPAGDRKGTVGAVPCLALPCLKSPLPPEGGGEGEREWSVERLHGELVATGKFENLDVDGVRQAVRSWKGWEKHGEEVVGEARCLGDPRVGNPLVWLNRVLGRYVGVEGRGKGEGVRGEVEKRPAGTAYVPLGERK